MPKALPFDISQDIGIYTDIKETNKRDKSNHKLYSCKCKVCGQTVLRVRYDIIHYHDTCLHNRENSPYIEGEKKEWTVYGVPCKNSKGYSKTGKIYDLWRHMILRSTPKYWKEYPTYEGTTISEEWHDYSTFCDDIQKLEGYEKWINNTKSRDMMLDKDTKILGNKHYSKETCCFLTHSESNKDVYQRWPQNMFHEEMIEFRKRQKTHKGKRIKAINKRTHEEIYFYSIKDCGKYIHTNPANIQMCLSDLPQYAGHYSCKGYVFKEVSKEEFEKNLDKVITYEIKENPDKN